MIIMIIIIIIAGYADSTAWTDPSVVAPVTDNNIMNNDPCINTAPIYTVYLYMCVCVSVIYIICIDILGLH